MAVETGTKKVLASMPAPNLFETFDPAITSYIYTDCTGTGGGNTSDAFSVAGTSVRSAQVRKYIIIKHRPRRSSVVGGDRAVTASHITNIFHLI
jgi:hypothetical protein